MQGLSDVHKAKVLFMKKGEVKKKNQENADIIVSSVKASKANMYAFYSLHLSDGKGKNLFSQCLVLRG